MQKSIRISGTQQLVTDQDRLDFTDVTQVLSEENFQAVLGNLQEVIALSGENSVQNHIKNENGFVFFGTPTIGELFKLISIFVGLQTGDKNLLNNGEEIYKKPVVIYKPDFKAEDLTRPTSWLTDRYTLFLKTLYDLNAAGTISQKIEELITIATTKEELRSAITEHKHPPQHLHLHQNKESSIDPKFLIPGSYSENYADAERLRVCVYTSASMKQDETSQAEAYELGRFIASLGNTELITGLGNVGLMLKTHLGCVESGGISSGANCPHIMRQENIPPGFSRLWVTADIYERMEKMYAPSDIVIIGGGGRGGGGTYQEFLGGLLLWQLKSDVFKPNPKFIGKVSDTIPMIVDNRLGMFTSMIRLAEVLGFNGKFRTVSGTAEVSQKIRDILSKGQS